MSTQEAASLESHLRACRDGGRKLLVPYVTGGLGSGWLDVVRAIAAAGADAIEIGIPFSDPVMDGLTIQEASRRALELGATPAQVIADAATLDIDVPLVVMTYTNPVAHMGFRRFAAALTSAGIAAAILPDLPVDELDGWADAADAHERRDRAARRADHPCPTDWPRSANGPAGSCTACRSWASPANAPISTSQASEMGRRLKAITDKPVLLGIGISTADQAVEAAGYGDGVIVGSALMARVLRGGGPRPRVSSWPSSAHALDRT